MKTINKMKRQLSEWEKIIANEATDTGLIFDKYKYTHTHTHTVNHFICVRLFATLWTVATRLLCPWDSPGKNTGVGCHAVLQGTFSTRRYDPCLLGLRHWQVDSLPLAPPGSANHVGSPWRPQGGSGVGQACTVICLPKDVTPGPKDLFEFICLPGPLGILFPTSVTGGWGVRLSRTLGPLVTAFLCPPLRPAGWVTSIRGTEVCGWGQKLPMDLAL